MATVEGGDPVPGSARHQAILALVVTRTAWRSTFVFTQAVLDEAIFPIAGYVLQEAGCRRGMTGALGKPRFFTPSASPSVG